MGCTERVLQVIAGWKSTTTSPERLTGSGRPGRKNWMFAGSDSGGEHAAVLYSLIGTCRLNNVEPEEWLRYVIEHIQDWPANRVRDLLPWKVDLSSQ
ncbi:transposase domain-containing protein [Escherichia coli]